MESIIKAPVSGELLPPAIERRNSLARRKPRVRRQRKGGGYAFQRGTRWYLQWYIGGRKYVQAAPPHCKNKSQCLDEIAKRLGEIKSGVATPAAYNKATVGELYNLFLPSRQNQCKASTVAWIQRVWTKHLEPFFGRAVATSVSLAVVDNYRARRKSQGASVCTVNREMTILKMMFSYAVKNGTLARMPNFPEKESEAPFVRTGAIGLDQYKALLKKAEPWLQTLLMIYFKYGFRKSELLNLRVRDINLSEPSINLPPFSTKNKRARKVIIAKGGDVFQRLSALVEGKEPDEHVFTRENGAPVLDFRAAWDSLVKGLKCGSGKGGKVTIHDLRRSAITQMKERGIDQSVSMSVAGHLTASVHQRYVSLSPEAAQKAAASIEGD